ncbi:universal stress protein [Saccharopolyspora sp. WRP15-2]|uniref:Universal stress protein n=1 Tax=Saccharopolyspora oryzae TaxID=2997343 RepID=A0ABT4UVB9_9PSEU|nr:universal stress protein [Saccharopolyspora oryzae]MDA3625156.1 universal stress protein [Saccharopolyspora oryzae]
MREANVVGVDGSDSALAAVQWAAVDSALHRVPLRLIHVESGSVGEDPLPAACRVATGAADVEVIPELRRGVPQAVLVEESARARRVAVGIRGVGGRSGLPVGSTADAVAMRAECPVVVVRGPVPDPGKPILLGVDGSRVGEAAVAVAFAEAAVRRVPLVAVHVWMDVEPAPWAAVDDRAWAVIAESEREVLAERLAGWQAEHPDVEVRRVVERNRPVRYLVEHAKAAQLIVVGSRGRGGMTGMLLGSTSRALLHIAPCPVLIARNPAA